MFVIFSVVANFLRHYIYLCAPSPNKKLDFTIARWFILMSLSCLCYISWFFFVFTVVKLAALNSISLRALKTVTNRLLSWRNIELFRCLFFIDTFTRFFLHRVLVWVIFRKWRHCARKARNPFAGIERSRKTSHLLVIFVVNPRQVRRK